MYFGVFYIFWVTWGISSINCSECWFWVIAQPQRLSIYKTAEAHGFMSQSKGKVIAKTFVAFSSQQFEKVVWAWEWICSAFIGVLIYNSFLHSDKAAAPKADAAPAAPASTPVKRLDNLFFIEEPKTAHVTESE